MKRLGIPATLFGSESLKLTELIRDAGEAANGLVITALTDGTAKFKKHYRAEYSNEPSNYQAQTYDAYTALALAIKNGAM
jgi:ABC-type branched-subunit amino acid transport system substrate-binding protein